MTSETFRFVSMAMDDALAVTVRCLSLNGCPAQYRAASDARKGLREDGCGDQKGCETCPGSLGTIPPGTAEPAKLIVQAERLQRYD